AFAPHQFRAGDIVGLQSPSSASGSGDSRREISGVIYRVRDRVITVAISDEIDIPDEWNERCAIKKLTNDVTYKRMIYALKDAKLYLANQMPPPHTVPEGWGVRHLNLMRTLLGRHEPSFSSETFENIQWMDPSLNGPQKEAIQFALRANELALIHGPPGTGKTHTLVELIRQLVLGMGKRVLVCGPSNLSVDNLVERLVRHKVPGVVRLGHPARLLPAIVDHSLDAVSRYSEDGQLVQDVRDEIDQTLAQLPKTKGWGARRQLYDSLKHLRKEYRERSTEAVRRIVANTRVALCTLNGAANREIQRVSFDVVIIDEASQCVEGESWIPLPKAPKLVLAGDHRQLPPTIKSQTAVSVVPIGSPTTAYRGSGAEVGADVRYDLPKKPQLDTTLFDRMLAMYGDKVTRMLTIQYRMHEAIMEYPSRTLYSSKLVAAPNVAGHVLADLEGVEDNENTRIPLVFYDTTDCGLTESVVEVAEPRKPKPGGGDQQQQATRAGGKKKKGKPTANSLSSLSSSSLLQSNLLSSKLNRGEADIVVKHVEELIGYGVNTSDIAVISPYNSQVDLLKSMLRTEYPEIEIGSVDGFQGREKEVVVLTLVRSNDKGEVGFLADYRRLNVAVTRARRHLCVIGDGWTLAHEPVFIKGFVEYLEENADLRYPD
ncbi:hypothetical protein EV182_004466, partial [Spiromyces aspiralis]